VTTTGPRDPDPPPGPGSTGQCKPSVKAAGGVCRTGRAAPREKTFRASARAEAARVSFLMEAAGGGPNHKEPAMDDAGRVPARDSALIGIVLPALFFIWML